MLEILTASGSTYTLPDEKAEAIATAMQDKTNTIIIGTNIIRASAIMEVKKVPNPKHLHYDSKPLLAAPTTELTDERRNSNISRIQQMKADYLKRKV